MISEFAGVQSRRLGLVLVPEAVSFKVTEMAKGVHRPVSGGAQNRAREFCFTKVPKGKTVCCSYQQIKEVF